MPSIEELNAQFDAQNAPDINALNAQFDAQNNLSQAAQKGENWATAGGNVTGGQEVPGFWKKAELITSGFDRGIKNFTLGLMSTIPLGDRYQNAIKQTDADATAKQEYNKKTYGDLYPTIGEVGGELTATAPLGGVFGGTAKIAAKLGEIAPTGLKTVAKYGSAGLLGDAAIAGMEGQRYDPENPGQPFNAEAAGKSLTNPAAIIAPMVGQKLSTWLGASKGLADAKEVIPSAMARNIKDPSLPTTMSDMLFGIPAALLGAGKQAQQVKNIGPEVIAPFIQKLANTTGAQSTDDLIGYSANAIQNSLKKLNGQEDKMWDAGFKTVPIKDVSAVKDSVSNAIDLLKTRKPEGYTVTVGDLNDLLRTGKMTVENVKQLQSIVSSASLNARGLEGGVGNKLADQLKDVKDNLLGHIQDSLPETQMKDFSAARAFSAAKFDLFDQAPALEKAVYNVANAHGLVKSLINDSGVLPAKQAALSVMDKEGRNMLAATKIRAAMKAADPTDSGKLNLETFLAKTGENSQSKFTMNTDAYKNLQGLNVYLRNISNANSQNGIWKTLTVGSGLAGIGGAMGLGALAGGPVGAAAGALGYGAATMAANHSPLKTATNWGINKAAEGISGASEKLASYGATNFVANSPKLKYILNGLTNLSAKGKDVNSSSIYKLLIDKVDRHLSKSGYIMTQDGVLQHKNEKE